MKKAAVPSILVAVVLLVLAVIAEAQQPKKVPRIGSLENTAALSAINLKPFRERLRELGYIEGQNIIFEHRYWEGKVERLPDLAAELIRLNCDVILTTGTEAAQAAKNMIKTIPVVMANSADAVRRGIVADLARPGGNITGLTAIGVELYGKRLELLKEVVPKLSRVGFLWSPTNPEADPALNETETAARSLQLGIQPIEVRGPADFVGAFQAATKKRAEALWYRAAGFSAFITNRS